MSVDITASGSGKVKLSAPSSTKLSPFSPICPSSPIQQVSFLNYNRINRKLGRRMKFCSLGETWSFQFNQLTGQFKFFQVVITTAETNSLDYRLKFDKEERSGTISLPL